MQKIIVIYFLLLLAYIPTRAQEDFTQYIDPTIGNVSKMLVPTYPTFHLPNQMLRMIPLKKDYTSDQVTAFPLQVASHRSKGIIHMKVSVGEMTEASWNRKMTIDQHLEINHPWHYATYLVDDDINLSFTPGEKCGIYQIDFPTAKDKNIFFQGAEEMESNPLGKGTFSIKEQINYKPRHVDISRNMNAYAYLVITDGEGKELENIRLNSTDNKLTISLDEEEPITVFIKYGISYVSNEQARKNYYRELSRVSFDQLAKKGKTKWQQAINKIQVKGGTTSQKRTFYTALYRTHERMVNINEDGKYYSGYDNKVHKSDRPFYIDDWVWDSYRAQHPLYTLLNPQIANDVLNSYTLMYEQSGWMPTFPQVFGNRLGMNAFHSSAIFIDGYRKGLRDYDVDKAHEGIMKNMTKATFIPWRQGYVKRPIDDFYHRQGYYPALQAGEQETESLVDKVEKRQAVAVTLGLSYDAWTLAELSKELHKEELYQKFSGISKNYKKLWHPEKLFFMPKDAKGNWIDIDPKWDGGIAFRDYYDENNGWTYAWDVQHDIDGLIELLGGKKQAEARLDELFREPLGMRKREFFVRGANSTGMVGQFAMGNEPSFHIPYLYNYFGVPWKTQKMTRLLLDVWFNDTVHGIPGDEDGGGMSAFVVFSSIGLYPVTPGIPEYAITSPLFEEVAIKLDNGKTFKIIAKGSSKRNKYIQKAFLNGKEISRPAVSHNQIIDGGTLELILADKPNKQWGKMQ